MLAAVGGYRQGHFSEEEIFLDNMRPAPGYEAHLEIVRERKSTVLRNGWQQHPGRCGGVGLLDGVGGA
ncbi:MAG: hypothetical protein U0938_12435 [Thiobacillus sp.]|nr:hypothetical protein [Thiobacillus sp.]